MINKRKMKSSKHNNVFADQKKPCHTVVYEFKELDNTHSLYESGTYGGDTGLKDEIRQQGDEKLVGGTQVREGLKLNYQKNEVDGAE